MIVFAVNVHTGGGKVLLDALLTEQPLGPVSAAYLDARYVPPDSSGKANYRFFRPTVWERIKAQIELKKVNHDSSNQEPVLFFGNYPPFFKFRNKSIVYLQNCFLLSSIPLPTDSIFEKIRNFAERVLLRVFSKNIDEIWVQTKWMQSITEIDFPKASILLKPFLPQFPAVPPKPKVYDFISVTSESNHKNIRGILEALTVLDKKLNKKIKVCFVLSDGRCKNVARFIQSNPKNIVVEIKTKITRNDLFDLYTQSKTALISSEFESFCLPLYEAHHYGLNIIVNDRPVFRESPLVNCFVDFLSAEKTALALEKEIQSATQKL